MLLSAKVTVLLRSSETIERTHLSPCTHILYIYKIYNCLMFATSSQERQETNKEMSGIRLELLGLKTDKERKRDSWPNKRDGMYRTCWVLDTGLETFPVALPTMCAHKFKQLRSVRCSWSNSAINIIARRICFISFLITLPWSHLTAGS